MGVQALHGMASSRVGEIREWQKQLLKHAAERKPMQKVVDSAGILLKNRQMREKVQELTEKLTDLQTRSHPRSKMSFPR
jgi:hypothetical protein